MLYKETICQECRGYGFITESTECSISSKPCPARCHEGRIVVPITNGDLIRRCTNEQLLKALINLTHNAIYSGGEHNRLLLSTPEDFAFWLDKATDDLDLRTVFDFVDEKDFEHPWTKVTEI
jgi:hypothetical protein